MLLPFLHQDFWRLNPQQSGSFYNSFLNWIKLKSKSMNIYRGYIFHHRYLRLFRYKINAAIHHILKLYLIRNWFLVNTCLYSRHFYGLIQLVVIDTAFDKWMRQRGNYILENSRQSLNPCQFKCENSYE